MISVQDIISRKIANRLVLLLALLTCTLSLLSGSVPNLALFGVTLLIGFFICQFNIIGAGDVKLVAALSLLFSQSHFYDFLFLTLLFGGAVALFSLFFFYRSTTANGIPYGVAIALGFVFSFSLSQ